jgi:hypothetical protein
MSTARLRARADDGQITLLVLVYTLIAFSLVAVVADITAVHLARTQLLDAADAAALDAADALTGATPYSAGLAGEAVPLTDQGVRDQAERYLSTYAPPSRLDRVALTGATGTQDGASATVQLAGRVRLPVAAAVVAGFSGGITVTVSSTARAVIEPDAGPPP